VVPPAGLAMGGVDSCRHYEHRADSLRDLRRQSAASLSTPSYNLSGRGHARSGPASSHRNRGVVFLEQPPQPAGQEEASMEALRTRLLQTVQQSRGGGRGGGGSGRGSGRGGGRW
jgi:hypothetical protein